MWRSSLFPSKIARGLVSAIPSRKRLQPVDSFLPEQAQRECRLIVSERLAEVRISSAGLAVRRAGDGSEFGKHYTRTLLGGEANRSFYVLLLGVRVSDNDVRGNRTGACLAQFPHGIRKFL